MNKIALATRYNFEFADGEKCEMTLAFIALKKLSTKRKSLYERAMKVLSNGGKDIFDNLGLLYCAYVCANMDESENLLNEDEFIEKCGGDFAAVNEALTALTNPKKHKDSANLSN